MHPANGPVHRRRRALAALLALGLVAGFWSAVWRDLDASVLTLVPMLDEVHYLRTAEELATAGWRPDGPFYMPPSYTALVAATGSGRQLDAQRVRLGEPPWGIRLLHAVCWLGTAWLLWRVGAALYGRRWGWLPPLLWLGYLPAAVKVTQVLLEVPLTFTATLALAIAGGWLQRDRAHPVAPALPARSAFARAAVLAGVAVGVAVLLRATAVVLLVPVGWLLVRAAGPPPAPRRTIVLLVLATVATVLPWAAWNSVLAGRLVGPSLNGGVNLYLGNFAGASGFFRSLEGFDMERDPGGVQYLSRLLGEPIADLAAADATWRRLALQEMRRDPGRSLGLWLRKVRLHLTALEIPQISPLAAWRQDAALLRLLVVPWGLLAAGGLAGAVLGWRRWPALRPWLLAVALLIAAQSVFFVVGRYRLILVPALALATSAALQAMLTVRGRALAWRLAVVLLATAAVWPWHLAQARQQFAVQASENLAIRWTHVAQSRRQAADPAGAEHSWRRADAFYAEALAADPWSVRRRLEAARVRLALADTSAALTLLGGHPRGLAADAQLPRLAANLLLTAGRIDEAVPYLRATLAHDPRDPAQLYNLALALSHQGVWDEVLALCDRLRQVEPARPRADLLAARTLLAQGRSADARQVLTAALQRLPGEPQLQDLLGRIEQAGPAE